MILLALVAWLGVHWPHGSLWYDETLTAWVAGGPLERLWTWCTQVDIQVPLHYVVLHGWMALAGNSEFALNLLSALCAMLAVAAFMALARRLLGQSGALAGSILLAATPGFLWVAYEVRAYALALALYGWASVFLFEMLRPARRPWLVAGYILLAMAMLYTHYTGLGALAAHAVIAFWTAWQRRSGTLLRRAALAGVIIVLGFAPWLPILLARGPADRSYYAGSIPPLQTLGVILSFKWLARDDFAWQTPAGETGPLAPFVLGGLIFLIAGAGLWLIQKRRLPPLVYGLCLALFPSAMVAAIVYFRPKLAGRYVWPAWAGLDLLLAVGLVALAGFAARRLGTRRESIFAFGAAVVLGALPWLTGQTGSPPDSDFRGAFAAIRTRWEPGDLLVLRDGTLFTAAEYYNAPLPRLGLPDALITDATHVLHLEGARPPLTAQPDSIRGVWVVAWQGDVLDPENLTAALLERIGARQDVPGQFGDVRVDYYRLTRPLSALRDLVKLPDKPLATLPGALSLAGVELVPDPSGDHFIAHTWWLRTGPADSATNAIRVSIRLVGPEGKTYGQIDQPPAGWIYFPERWPEWTLVLGRYEMRLPAEPPPALTMKLVLYSASGGLAPQEITVGTVNIPPR